ncbi:MAG: hypothetical protein HY243_17875 [Proteobacteria bacterium]|nr:hypothetical protein [Pseudomonadota bacterium]
MKVQSATSKFAARGIALAILIASGALVPADSGMAAAARARRCGKMLHTGQTATSTISGILKSSMEYGPPNFGELKTDPKVWIWVVRLDVPVPVATGEDEVWMKREIVTVKEIEVSRFSKNYETLARYRNRHVRVHGSLSSAVEWQDFTNPVIVADSIVPDGTTDCRGKEIIVPK